MLSPNVVTETMGGESDRIDNENFESLVAETRTPEKAQVIDPQARVDNNRTVKIAIALALVLVVVIALLSIFSNVQNKVEDIASCDLDYCLPYKVMLKQRLMDGAIDPCSNIYRVACDLWSIEGTHSIYRDGMDRFINRATAQLASTKVSSEGDQSSSDKAARFFQSCQDTILGGISQLAELVTHVTNAGVVWPRTQKNPNVLATMARLRLTFDLDTLLDIVMNKHTRQVSVGPSDWIRTRDSTMHDNLELIKMTYESLTSALLPYSCPNTSCQPVALRAFQALAQAVYEFLGAKAFPLGSYLCDVRTLSRLTTAFEKRRWEGVFGSVFNLSNGSIVVQMTSFEYVDALNTLVREIGEESVDYYIGWLVYLELAPFADSNIAIAHCLGKRYLLTAITPFACLQRTERFFGVATYNDLMRQISPATLQLAANISSDIQKYLLYRLKQRPEWAGSESLLVDIGSGMDDYKHSSALLDRHFSTAPSMGAKFIANWIRLVKAGFSQHRLRGSGFGADFTVQRAANGLQPREIGRGVPLLPPFALDLRLLSQFGNPAENYGRFGVYAAVTMLTKLLRNVSGNPAWTELFSNATSCFGASGVRPQDEQQITIKAQALKTVFEAFENTVSSTQMVWKARLRKQIFFLSFASLWCSHFHRNQWEADVNNMCLMTPGFLSAYDCTADVPRHCFFL